MTGEIEVLIVLALSVLVYVLTGGLKHDLPGQPLGHLRQLLIGYRAVRLTQGEDRRVPGRHGTALVVAATEDLERPAGRADFSHRAEVIETLRAHQATFDWQGRGEEAYDDFLRYMGRLVDRAVRLKARPSRALREWSAVQELDGQGTDRFHPVRYTYPVEAEIAAGGQMVATISRRMRVPMQYFREAKVATIALGDADDTAEVAARLATVRDEIAEALEGSESPYVLAMSRLEANLYERAAAYDRGQEAKLENGRVLQALNRPSSQAPV